MGEKVCRLRLSSQWFHVRGIGCQWSSVHCFGDVGWHRVGLRFWFPGFSRLADAKKRFWNGFEVRGLNPARV